MKKMAFVLLAGLVFGIILPGPILADLDGIIKDTRSLLSFLEIQNVTLNNMVNYMLAVSPETSQVFTESVAMKILLEEEQVLISKSYKLLNEMEKSQRKTEKERKDIEVKMTELSQSMAKIFSIHMKVINSLDEKFDNLIKELNKGTKTPV